MVNIKTDFGAVGDGVNDDSPAFIAFNTYALALNVTAPNQAIHLILPPGVYNVNNNISTTATRWMQGVKRLYVDAYGASFTSTVAISRPGAWPSDGTTICPINTAHIGDTTVTLINLSDASKLNAKQWIALGAFDMQGSGSAPPNQYLFEYVQILSVDSETGIVSLNSELSNNYLSTYPFQSSATEGPAAIFIMSMFWDSELYIRGLEFAQNGINDVFGCARRVELIDCKFTHHSWAPTSSNYIKIINTDLGPGMELDKVIRNIEFDGCWMNSNNPGSQAILVQSSSVTFMSMNNCLLRNVNGTPAHFAARNCSFNKMNIGSIAYGCTKSVLLENCYVGNLTAVQNGSVGVPKGSIVNGVITVPKTVVGQGPPQGFYPGSIMFATNSVSGGDVYPLSFATLDVQTDGTNYIVYTTLPSSFSAPTLSGNYRFQRHPCPNFTVRNCFGCDHVVNAAHAQSGRPIHSYVRKLLTGYFGSTTLTVGPKMNIWGTIVSVTVNVLRAYTGAQPTLTMKLGQFGAASVATDGITTFNWAAVFNLKIAGKRVITATGNTGLQSGDADPGSGAFWFRNVVQPFLSADTSADGLYQQAIVEIEIITDQGLPDIENLQFGMIKFPGL